MKKRFVFLSLFPYASAFVSDPGRISGERPSQGVGGLVKVYFIHDVRLTNA
jgi:hypothetical protein